jgi:hypothetical protein
MISTRTVQDELLFDIELFSGVNKDRIKDTLYSETILSTVDEPTFDCDLFKQLITLPRWQHVGSSEFVDNLFLRILSGSSQLEERGEMIDLVLKKAKSHSALIVAALTKPNEMFTEKSATQILQMYLEKYSKLSDEYRGNLEALQCAIKKKSVKDFRTTQEVLNNLNSMKVNPLGLLRKNDIDAKSDVPSNNIIQVYFREFKKTKGHHVFLDCASTLILRDIRKALLKCRGNVPFFLQRDVPPVVKHQLDKINEMLNQTLSLTELSAQLNSMLSSAKNEMRPEIFAEFNSIYGYAIKTLSQILNEAKKLKLEPDDKVLHRMTMK